jgi:hypothetical protein
MLRRMKLAHRGVGADVPASAIIEGVALGLAIPAALGVGIAKLFGASWKTAAFVGAGAVAVDLILVAIHHPAGVVPLTPNGQLMPSGYSIVLDGRPAQDELVGDWAYLPAGAQWVSWNGVTTGLPTNGGPIQVTAASTAVWVDSSGAQHTTSIGV